MDVLLYCYFSAGISYTDFAINHFISMRVTLLNNWFSIFDLESLAGISMIEGLCTGMG